MKNSFRFFQNKECKYFPCHNTLESHNFNCMFCYCPLYMLQENCGGSFTYKNGVKNCSNCLLPHSLNGYDYINNKLSEYIKNEKEEREKG